MLQADFADWQPDFDDNPSTDDDDFDYEYLDDDFEDDGGAEEIYDIKDLED